jgi:hypothetical protein
LDHSGKLTGSYLASFADAFVGLDPAKTGQSR